jgi:hypothetical protein
VLSLQKEATADAAAYCDMQSTKYMGQCRVLNVKAGGKDSYVCVFKGYGGDDNPSLTSA